MFGRIFIQLLRASLWRLLLALAAVVGGGAVSSALLNIHFDAERKLTQEFAALGPNVVVAPQAGGSPAGESPMAEEALVAHIRAAAGAELPAAVPYLYFVARGADRSVIVAGTHLGEALRASPWLRLEGAAPAAAESGACLLGARVAAQSGASRGTQFALHYGGRAFSCTVAGVVTGGAAEDSHVFISLADAQQLTRLAGMLTLVQVRVSGPAQTVTAAVGRIGRALPGFEVRPIRQIAAAEGQILERIRGLILATVAVILGLTALCVLATMSALAYQHRRDVGLMKALGGEMSRVMRLFLSEAAALGALGGLLGWLVGLGLSAWIGRQVFHAAITPRWEVLPLTVALMIGVALAGALPLRLLGSVRPAVILRGE